MVRSGARIRSRVYSIVSAPLYYDGMVITGFARRRHGHARPHQGVQRGDRQAAVDLLHDPGAGRIRRRHLAARTTRCYKYGGAPVWQTPAVDPELGLIYFTTGNAAPGLQRLGSQGRQSVHRVDRRARREDGKVRWHFQQVHHDIWDYDSPNPVVLFDAPYDGTMRKGIAEVSKTGWVYILDRETGEPLIGIEDQARAAGAAPAHRGDAALSDRRSPLPAVRRHRAGGFTLVNGGKIFTPFWDKVVFYRPQMAVNWPPSSYDPETITSSSAASTTWRLLHRRQAVRAAEVRGDVHAPGGFTFVQVARRGVFAAFDLKTNRLVWSQQWPEALLQRLDRHGGRAGVHRPQRRASHGARQDHRLQLWQFQTDAGVNATASTFEHKGKQYVVVMSAGTLFGVGKKGDSMWLFSLDGTIESFPPAGGTAEFLRAAAVRPK